MSKIKTVAVLAALVVLSGNLAARAETGSTPAAGPEHEHDHAATTGAPDESLADYFNRKSDEAFHQGQYDRAIGLQKAIIALEPDNSDAYGGAAWLLWSLGRGEEAVQFLERGLKANPNDWDMWNEAGLNYDLQKLSKQSQAAYTRALQLLPKDEDSQMLRRRLAHAAEKAPDWETALTTWRDLVRDFPNDAVNKNNLARVEKTMATPPAQ